MTVTITTPDGTSWYVETTLETLWKDILVYAASRWESQSAAAVGTALLAVLNAGR